MLFGTCICFLKVDWKGLDLLVLARQGALFFEVGKSAELKALQDACAQVVSGTMSCMRFVRDDVLIGPTTDSWDQYP
jgi:hypothetical protein